jgi:hypothetical protein
MRCILSLFGSAGIALAIGCTPVGKRPELKPPKEDFHIPPPAVASQPATYPNDMLNRVPLRKKNDDEDLMPPSGGPGMGAGMPSAAAMGR